MTTILRFKSDINSQERTFGVLLNQLQLLSGFAHKLYANRVPLESNAEGLKFHGAYKCGTELNPQYKIWLGPTEHTLEFSSLSPDTAFFRITDDCTAGGKLVLYYLADALRFYGECAISDVLTGEITLSNELNRVPMHVELERLIAQDVKQATSPVEPSISGRPSQLAGHPKELLTLVHRVGPGAYVIHELNPGEWAWKASFDYSAATFESAVDALDDAWDVVMHQMAIDRGIPLSCLAGDSPEKFYFEDICRMVRQHLAKYSK